MERKRIYSAEQIEHLLYGMADRMGEMQQEINLLTKRVNVLEGKDALDGFI